MTTPCTTRLEPDAIWQAVDPAFTCHGAQEIADTFLAARDTAVDIESMELIGGSRHAILRVRWPEVEASDADFLDGIYSVFEIVEHRIRRIEDFVEREDALTAAGLGED